MKYFAKNYSKEYRVKAIKDFTKDNFDYDIDLKDEQVLKQVFEQVFELYRNENENNNFKSNSLNIEEREKEFKEAVKKFSSNYPIETLKEFFNYWSEPNQSKKKMKFELQDTFDIGRRLVTWTKNEKSFGTKKEDKPKNLGI